MRKNSVLLLIALSVVLAIVFATTFVVVLSLSLPPTDGAYGSAPFGDSLVLPVMLMIAIPAGLLTSPMLVWALRTRSVGHGLLYVAGLPLAAILCFTLLNPALGFLLSFPAYALGCILAREFARHDFLSEPAQGGVARRSAEVQLGPPGVAVIRFRTIAVDFRPAVEPDHRNRSAVLPGLALVAFMGSTCSCFAGAGIHWVAGSLGVCLTAFVVLVGFRRWELVYPEGSLWVPHSLEVAHSLTFGKDGVVLGSGAAERRWEWSDLRQAALRGRSLELLFGDGSCIAVPNLAAPDLDSTVAVLSSHRVSIVIPPCPACGHELRRSPFSRCPECGNVASSA